MVVRSCSAEYSTIFLITMREPKLYKDKFQLAVCICIRDRFVHKLEITSQGERRQQLTEVY